MLNARIRHVLVPLLIAFASAGAWAIDLVSQAPSLDSLEGLQADNATGSFAQDFAAPPGSILESIVWWGYHGANSAGANSDAFAVSLDGALQSGTIVAESILTADTKTLTKYTLDVADAPLTATRLDIVNDSLDVEWFWQYRALSVPNQERVAFAFVGSIPEPTTYVLMLAGLVTVAGVARRTRRA